MYIYKIYSHTYIHSWTHTSFTPQFAKTKKVEERGTCLHFPWPVHAVVDEFCYACWFGIGDSVLSGVGVVMQPTFSCISAGESSLSSM